MSAGDWNVSANGSNVTASDRIVSAGIWNDMASDSNVSAGECIVWMAAGMLRHALATE